MTKKNFAKYYIAQKIDKKKIPKTLKVIISGDGNGMPYSYSLQTVSDHYFCMSPGGDSLKNPITYQISIMTS